MSGNHSTEANRAAAKSEKALGVGFVATVSLKRQRARKKGMTKMCVKIK